jgi:putative endonuclease
MTENVEARLKRHESGKVRSTRSRKPFRLIHTEEYPDRQQARKREKYLKSDPGHWELAMILTEGRVPRPIEKTSDNVSG